MHANEHYLRQLQQAFGELITAYKKLETLEEKRTDTGLTVGADDLTQFPHLTTDIVTNAQFTFAELKTLLDSGHRANINKIIP